MCVLKDRRAWAANFEATLARPVLLKKRTFSDHNPKIPVRIAVRRLRVIDVLPYTAHSGTGILESHRNCDAHERVLRFT